MRMAKASQRDIDAGYKLCGILDAISRGHYPLPEHAEFGDNFPTFFDPEDPAHLRHFYDLVRDLLDEAPGMPGRIIGGMCAVILYDKNQIVDPDADTLELHPRLQQALAAAETEPALRNFAESCLNPERNGYAVPAHVRDDARRALGIPACETITDRTYFAHRASGGAVFVKHGPYFAEQGGTYLNWGKSWKRIEADSVDDARAIAERTLP